MNLSPYFTQMTEEEARNARPIMDCIVRVENKFKYERWVSTDSLPMVPCDILDIESECVALVKQAGKMNSKPPYKEPTWELDGVYVIVDDRVSRPNLIQINFDDGRVGLVCELDQRVGGYWKNSVWITEPMDINWGQENSDKIDEKGYE